MLKDQLGGFAGGAQHSLLDAEGAVNEDAVGQAPTEAEMVNEYAAPGEDATLPYGISYSADWKSFADGIAKHAREQIKALAATGLPIHLKYLGTRLLLSEELTEEAKKVEYLEEVSLSRTAIAIKHLIIHSPKILENLVCPGAGTLDEEDVARVYKSTILYTSWERDTVEAPLVEVLKRLGQIWVPCSANKRAFVESGIDPAKVRIVPYPFDPNTCTLSAPRGSERVPRGKRFYHIGKWEPRKNQHQILGAFLQAYTPKDRASLLFKTSPFGSTWAGYPSPDESIKFWLGQEEVKANGWDIDSLDRLVRILSEKLPEDELMAIHEKNNIYVSASAGEAWEIPAFDAKTTGNRVVHLGFGGTEEYAEQDDVQVPYTMTPAHLGYGWEPEAKWASVRTADLVAGMKKAEPPKRRALPASYVRRFGHASVGRLMEENIEDLATELGCWETLRNVGGFG